jgi:hypothetical protein
MEERQQNKIACQNLIKFNETKYKKVADEMLASNRKIYKKSQ